MPNSSVSATAEELRELRRELERSQTSGKHQRPPSSSRRQRTVALADLAKQFYGSDKTLRAEIEKARQANRAVQAVEDESYDRIHKEYPIYHFDINNPTEREKAKKLFKTDPIKGAAAYVIGSSDSKHDKRYINMPPFDYEAADAKRADLLKRLRDENNSGYPQKVLDWAREHNSKGGVTPDRAFRSILNIDQGSLLEHESGHMAYYAPHRRQKPKPNTAGHDIENITNAMTRMKSHIGKPAETHQAMGKFQREYFKATGKRMTGDPKEFYQFFGEDKPPAYLTGEGSRLFYYLKDLQEKSGDPSTDKARKRKLEAIREALPAFVQNRSGNPQTGRA